MSKKPYRFRMLDFPRSLGRRYVPALIATILVTILVGLLDSVAIALIVPLAEFVINTDVTPADSFLLRWSASLFSLLGLTLSMRWTIALIISLQGLRALGMFIQTWLTAFVEAKYETDLRSTAYRSTLGAKWKFFFGQRSGDIINVIDVQVGRAGTAFQLFVGVVASIVSILVYLSAAILISWDFTLIAIILASLIFGAVNILIIYARRLGERTTAAARAMSAEATDVLTNVKTVKSGALEHAAAERFIRLSDRLASADVAAARNQGVLGAVSELAFVIALFGAMLIGLRVLSVSPGDLLLFALLLLRAYQRVRNLQSQLHEFNYALPSVGAVHELIETSSADREAPAGEQFQSLSLGIQVDNVSFSYDDRVTILRDISIEVPRGRMVALAGPSGVGKTTMIDLLTGLIEPIYGTVKIDNRPLGSYDVYSWRRRISYVPQDTILFNESVRNNIIWGREGISRGQIEAAMRISCADEFISQLPGGLDTPLGERGIRLSGGQRQRLALARALARQPELLILDEATSALDGVTEDRIFSRLTSMTRDRMTILVVSHRISAVMRADVVYVLENGAVAECGSPEELMDARGLLYRLKGREDVSEVITASGKE